MSVKNKGVTGCELRSTPLAVIDFETTGLRAGADRVVEVSVVRIDPGKPPQLVLDTLIDPDRRMGATEIHGITEGDVAGAPKFHEIAGSLVRALSGCVVASYNVYFDIGFLEYELGKAGLRYTPPHLCLMYMRPMLGIGGRCSLEDACQAHGIPMTPVHQTAVDALAAARLWNHYQTTFPSDLRTYQDLADRKWYKFVDSFKHDPMPPPAAESFQSTGRAKSRSVKSGSPIQPQQAKPALAPLQGRIQSYWESLKAILSDLNVTDEEIQYLAKKRAALQLNTDQVRSLHARAFASVTAQMVEDQVLDDRECQTLRRLHQCLSRLGWAPGE